MRCDSFPACAERQHDERHRQQRGARRERRVAERLLKLQGDEEDGAAQCAVDEEGHEVRARELPRAEDRQRQHRVRGAMLRDDERREEGRAGGERGEHHRRAPPARRPLDEAVDQAAQAEGGRQRGPGQIEPFVARRSPGLRHMADRHPQDRGDQRQVDEEDEPPGDRLDQVPADEGPDGCGEAAETRPEADRVRPLVRVEARLDDGEATRREQRPADALQGARRDEHGRAARSRTAATPPRTR